MPESLAAVLALVQILLGYGRRIAQITADAAQAAHPRFATVAVVCGTYDLTLIGARIQRGILRLLALEAYPPQTPPRLRPEPGPHPHFRGNASRGPP